MTELKPTLQPTERFSELSSPSPSCSAAGFSASRAHPTRVLVVEGPSVFREIQLLLLQRAGYVVKACDHPETALAAVAEAPFDVALLNSESTALDKPEFLISLRKHRPGIALIFVTSILTVELTRSLNRNGVAVVLQRPVTPSVLIRTLDDLTEARVRPATPRSMLAAPTGETHAEPSTILAGKSSPPAPSASASPFASFLDFKVVSGPAHEPDGRTVPGAWQTR